MKLKTFFALLILNCSTAFLVAQVAHTVDEAKKLRPVSDLKRLAELEGLNSDYLGAAALGKILANRQGDLFGDIGDMAKFATLQELCAKIEQSPERYQIERRAICFI